MSSIQNGSTGYGAVFSPCVENGPLRFDSNLKMLQDFLRCEKGNSSKQIVGGEARKDSGIEVDDIEQMNSEKTNFLDSCSVEFDRLFEFINKVLTQEELKLKLFDYNRDSDGYSKPLLSSLDFKTNYKEPLADAVDTLQTTVTGLEQLLQEYDEYYGGSDGDAIIRRKKKKQNALERKLMRELSDVDKRKGERSAMEQSRKEYFGYWYWSMMLLLVACGLVVCCLEIYCLWLPACTRWTILLKVFRSPLMVAFYCFLVGFNIMAWSRTGINYPRLFGFPRKGVPTPRIMFDAASVLTIIIAVHMVVYLFLADYYPVAYKAMGVSIYICFAIFLLNPFKIFLRSGRFALVVLFLRMVVSPLSKASFSNVWFTDQMNSLVNVMVDIEDFTYHLFDNSWTRIASSTPISNLVIHAVLSSLPALWRLVQCLRVAYVDKKYIQIVNAFKYSTTLLLVVMSTLYTYFIQCQKKSLDREKWVWLIIVLLCFSALLNCFYCFFWDIFYDWHLFHCTGSDCPRSKKNLFFEKKWYYLATVFNFTVRFAKAMKYFYIITTIEDQVWGSDLIFTVLAVSEVTRRFVWNYFRVEWEHIDNACQSENIKNAETKKIKPSLQNLS